MNETSIFDQKKAYEYATAFEGKMSVSAEQSNAQVNTLTEMQGMIAEVRRSIDAGEGIFNEATFLDMQQKHQICIDAAKVAVGAL